MLSLKRFLNVSEEEHTLRRVVSLLLEKIGSGAVEGDSLEYRDFRSEMTQLSERAASEATPELLLVTAGSVVQSMESHNRRISALLRRQGGELQSIVSMIAETAVKIGGENTRAAQRLQEIGNRFERAGALDDLQALKTHLGDCLNSFREEARRQKSESDTAIQSLQQEIERRSVTAGAANVVDLDPVTGLPRHTAALRAMDEAVQSGKRMYIAVMVVKGVQSVNARFGFGIGDRMLRAFKENVEKRLPRTDKLFRWEGPAIIVLLDRKDPLEQVRAEIRRMLDRQLEEAFHTDGRSVMIPISAAWLVSALMPPVATAVKAIQSFIATQGCHDASA